MKRLRLFFLLATLVVMVTSTNLLTAQDAMDFSGITLDVVTFTGPQIAEPLQRRGQEFSEMTGATVNVVTVPFSDLYQSILTDQATGTNSYDAFIFAPQWIVDYAVPGYLADLTDFVANDPGIEWDDVAPFFRDFSSSYEGSIYTIPLDGDFHIVYYRTDVLAELGMEPPRTWDDYLAIAEAANGMDMNGDGRGDYGSCISKARNQQSYWWIHSIASGFLQSQGTSQGVFFDTETMNPLVNNEGFIRALEIYQATNAFGPPDEQSLNVGDTRSLTITGRCALTLDWGDIGSLAVDPEQSVVQGLIGAVITPGSTQVVDRATGALVDCNDELCPYAVDGVNHAPFASFGGWSGAISAAADEETAAAAYALFSYMSAPAQSNVDVTIGATGFNPYRTSQFTEFDAWLDAGFDEASAAAYLGAIEDSLNSPNVVLDLRIPQNQRYQQIILDTVLSQFLAGEFTAEEAVQEIESRWQEITDELGRDDQLSAYRATIGAD